MAIVSKQGEKLDIPKEDAPIMYALIEFLELNEWDDNILFDKDTGDSRLAFRTGINDQQYQFFIEGSDADDFISVFAYTPFSAPPDRIEELCRLLNSINLAIDLGRIGIADNGKANSIQYKIRYDLEEGVCSGRMIDNCVNQAIELYDTFQQPITEVVFGGKTAVEAWAAHVERVGDED
jgi:hypothetical protein